MLFKTLDRQAWKESGYNPDKMLREFPRKLLEKAAADADYIRGYDDDPSNNEAVLGKVLEIA